jgi:hypothetical protein
MTTPNGVQEGDGTSGVASGSRDSFLWGFPLSMVACLMAMVRFAGGDIDAARRSLREALVMTSMRVKGCSSAHRRRRFGALLAGALAGATLCPAVGWTQEKSPDPALLEKLGILMTQKGLDTRNNRLDALVGRLAVACSTEPPLDTRPCPGAKDLLIFLRELPPDLGAIGRELEALGTTCRKQEARIDCFYERHVHYESWAWGYDGPVGSGDEIYRLTFTVTKLGDELQYGVDYHFLAVPK